MELYTLVRVIHRRLKWLVFVVNVLILIVLSFFPELLPLLDKFRFLGLIDSSLRFLILRDRVRTDAISSAYKVLMVSNDVRNCEAASLVLIME